jgi:hypothetical protein
MSDVIDQLRGKAIARIAYRLFQKCVNLSMSGLHEPTAGLVGAIESRKPTRINVAPVTRPAETESTTHAEPLPFTVQIEQATKPIHLDVIARAIVAAKLPDDETQFLKDMVTEGRKRMKEAVTA